MPQVTTLTDETQTITIEQASGFPVLYSGEEILREALLSIGVLHAVEPIASVSFDPDSGPELGYLSVDLIDGRTVTYTFYNVDPDNEEFTIEFGGDPWLESSLELLNDLKNAILRLNAAFPIVDTDMPDYLFWESI